MLRVCLLLLGLALLGGCESHGRKSSPWQVCSQQNQLATELFLPKNFNKDGPIVVFVHGDGAADATSHGYYLPIINSLNANGFGAVSWHKPGVKGSTGNWLEQSMNDRAEEVEDVISSLRERGYVGKIGMLGFSQAGWVLPYVDNASIDFAALVSPAINWQQQGQYMMKQRLINDSLIADGDEAAMKTIQSLSAQEYQLFKNGFDAYKQSELHQHPFMSDPIDDEERFNFVRLNIDEDSTQGLYNLTVPLLVLMGDRDIAVDVEDTLSTLFELAETRDQSQLEFNVFSGANHQLLKDDEFTHLSGFDWYFEYQKQQEKAFVDGVLLYLNNWLVKQASAN